MILIDNLHTQYLSDVNSLTLGDEIILYYDKDLNLTNQLDAFFDTKL